MKNLYESILDDIDVQMEQGDNWVKEIEKEKKEFLKVISTAKNYKGWGLKNERYIEFSVPNVLHELGYDADHIRLLMYVNENNGWISGNWVLEIEISKLSDDGMRRKRRVWCNSIRITRGVADDWRGFIKNIIKPTTKSLDTFKKLLDNMEKHNGRPIEVNLLLK